jgi:hypothetical protein
LDGLCIVSAKSETDEAALWSIQIRGLRIQFVIRKDVFSIFAQVQAAWQ